MVDPPLGAGLIFDVPKPAVLGDLVANIHSPSDLLFRPRQRGHIGHVGGLLFGAVAVRAYRVGVDSVSFVCVGFPARMTGGHFVKGLSTFLQVQIAVALAILITSVLSLFLSLSLL